MSAPDGPSSRAVQRPVITIRPQPGLDATLALGRQLGLTMHGFALSHVGPVDWELPDLARFDAMLVGSANAMRHAGDRLSALTHLPVHAVGKATAREARAAGFTIERLGKGGLQSVLDAVSPPLNYLRLVGNEYVELDWPRGVTFEPLQVYEVCPQPLPATAAAVLRESPVVLLHSAAMTRQFAAECDRLGVDRAQITLAAMGPRIAAQAAVEKGWSAIHTCDEPTDDALLALAAKLCL